MAWHAVADADSIGEDEAIGVDVDGMPIAVCRSDGAFHAVHDVCTHEYAMLSAGYVEGGYIECPLHQGRFELATGKAMCAPVTEPIKIYAVKLEGGKVLVDVGE